MNAEQVIRLACWARVELDMPREEFNRLSPASFSRMVKFRREKEKRLQMYVGQLRHTMAVSAGSKLEGGEPLPFNFFFPGYKKKRQRRLPNPIAALCAIVGRDRVNDLRKKKNGNQ